MIAAAPVGRLRGLRFPVVDLRIVTGIALVAASVVGGLRLSAAPAPATRVYVAAADLDAGHVLTRADLDAVAIRGPVAVTRTLERVGSGRPLGRVLVTPLRAGAPVSVSAIGPIEAPGRELTVPVTPEHGLGGAVRAGDRVDVLATFDKGTDAARTLTVAQDATVRKVTHADGLFGQQEGAVTAVTLSVDPDAAVALAFAARNGDLDIVRARGARVRARVRFDADSLR